MADQRIEMRVRAPAPGNAEREGLDPAAVDPSSELAVTGGSAHPMDGEAARKELRQLLSWFYLERDLQASNRLEMAIDADMYDGIQWDEDDAAELDDRGQMPLVYNELAPMCDWMIGTERRTRVDWKVLPRTEDGVQDADIKTKVLKYVSDINRTSWARSRAFADAIKVGVGWTDAGPRDDPTKDVLYSKYEDWRRVLWDSRSYELDLDDARYQFRWRMVDLDIALMMFPDRAAAIRRSVEDIARGVQDWDDLGLPASNTAGTGYLRSGTYSMSGEPSTGAEPSREQVRLIECQYRKPVRVPVVDDGPHRGSIADPRDLGLMQAVSAAGSRIVDRVAMRMHTAVFTETTMLEYGPSMLRHNSFSLTPVWCYRFGRTRLPYGAIRRVRDIQRDMNKRASKALFLLNTNQLIMDEGAVEDIDVAADEARRPDGTIIKKHGKDFEIRRDYAEANGQLEMMQLGANTIQRSMGIADENLGRQTNAVSGEAIKARQIQGSVVTTEPFDNLRLAIQVEGQKLLSLIEQFYTDEKVIRLTGGRAIEWVNVNVPEVQPDGSVRYINDLTERAADFVVSEQDYSGTLRQVMFDSMIQAAQRLDPQVALRLMRMAYEYSDLPNKDKIAEELRALTGERDPNKELTPEEQQQAALQEQQQLEALQMQRDSALLALDEQRAKIRELNARAEKLEADAAPGSQNEGAINVIRSELGREIERLTEELRQANAKSAADTLRTRTAADTSLEQERIRAASNERIAEIRAASDERIARINAAMDRLGQDKPAD